MSGNSLVVGDVGGTNVRFAVASKQNGRVSVSDFEKFENDDFPAFYDALAAYLEKTGVSLKSACFAMAGFVSGGQIQLTNRDWHVSEAELCRRFNFNQALLINDFTGMAQSVPEHDAASFVPVKDGEGVDGAPILVTGAGTGIGVSTLVKIQNGWRVLPGEGGHTAFAPETDLEVEVMRFLLRRHKYVSNELVASGSGLDTVHEAFCEIFSREKLNITPADMQRLAEGGDKMFDALIHLRAQTLMRLAGDVALSVGARGGIVLAGGVTERIIDYVRTPESLARFYKRGPMTKYLKNCPIKLMKDPSAPLIGAAAYLFQEAPR